MRGRRVLVGTRDTLEANMMPRTNLGLLAKGKTKGHKDATSFIQDTCIALAAISKVEIGYRQLQTRRDPSAGVG